MSSPSGPCSSNRVHGVFSQTRPSYFAVQKGKTGWWLRPVSPAASGKRNLHRKVASPYSRGTLDRWLHSLARRARRWCASYNVRGLLSPASAEATVDGEDGAGYEVGCGRRKVDEGSGYFFDRCNASEGNTGRPVVAHAGRSSVRRASSVSTNVGATAFTVILCAAHSSASTCVNMTTAALLEQYAARS